MAPRPSLLGISSALWLLFASFAHDAAAHPFPKDDLHAAGYGYLMPRQCNQYCGYNNMFCCEEGTQCYTANGIAGCSSDAGGGWARYTTTWTLTQTFTKTYNSFVPAATAPPGTGDCVPPEGSGQIACGNICCASWQYCAYKGHGTATTTNTDTAAGAATSTGAVNPGGTAGGLSGGAIAGIVIGTIAGVALLLLICACCVVRGLWHGLLALLGIGGRKKKTETVIEEERYERRGSSHTHRDNHGSWYGGRPASASARKEKSKGAGLLGMGAALGTLALLLGLRRDHKKKAAPAKTRSDVASSYWSDSYTATSPSSRSSDRRTRHSRNSRAPSRVTRTTHTRTRVSRSRGPSVRSQRSPRP
ncbi:hypothetical protein CHGG_02795 [Chaetomium globosum CBS 148.51]|uniref:Uncharacterized protein n=1 Tax=Chaetomium globosum (strain ATCC 6205 / CBS 148.51 / DSM 1962 / NBRC 6347 / NRRL 1970) TaxID=306901 RepID=Q2HAF9_CHAGB|nr:uncharacterized protein CHGG_02795 [Chaetomium globosum CBS 148.51]EAQ90860.1 hypothetical protein CHGG_02795 [Chaetomium globosum CBS 148.51]